MTLRTRTAPAALGWIGRDFSICHKRDIESGGFCVTPPRLSGFRGPTEVVVEGIPISSLAKHTRAPYCGAPPIF